MWEYPRKLNSMANKNTNRLESFYIGLGMLMSDAALFLLLELLLMDIGEHQSRGFASFQIGYVPAWQHMVPFGLFAWGFINILLILYILCTVRGPRYRFLFSHRKQYSSLLKSPFSRIQLL